MLGSSPKNTFLRAGSYGTSSCGGVGVSKQNTNSRNINTNTNTNTKEETPQKNRPQTHVVPEIGYPPA
jgi:hypothetical protein